MTRGCWGLSLLLATGCMAQRDSAPTPPASIETTKVLRGRVDGRSGFHSEAVVNPPLAGAVSTKGDDGRFRDLARSERKKKAKEEVAGAGLLRVLAQAGERQAEQKAVAGKGDGPVAALDALFDAEDGARIELPSEDAPPTAALEEDFAFAEVADKDAGELRFMPRTAYFENLYLGGDAAHVERLRRLDADLGNTLSPWREAAMRPQPFDPPANEALALSLALDRVSLDAPGRVFLQVGLRGSPRFGWRRPPLELAVVLDPALIDAEGKRPLALMSALLRRLGPQDRLALILASAAPSVVAPLDAPRKLRVGLPGALKRLRAGGQGRALDAGMRHAGQLLTEATARKGRVPGTRIVLVVGNTTMAHAAPAMRSAAHDLALTGVVTSLVETLSSDAGAQNNLFEVAAAGHGNYHRSTHDDFDAAVTAELDALARVVARLVRVNIRLAPHVHAIRVVGSRALGEEEKAQVKAREVATDRELSAAMGITADRGDDDDGLQTVIPYFLGGDEHVILVELWAERPGPVADVSLRLKDMVNLRNATARASVGLSRLPRAATPTQGWVAGNLRHAQRADVFRRAGRLLEQGRPDAAIALLQARAQGSSDPMQRFVRLIDAHRGNSGRLADALRLAAARSLGAGAQAGMRATTTRSMPL